jgi:hypothetical protein
VLRAFRTKVLEPLGSDQYSPRFIEYYGKTLQNLGDSVSRKIAELQSLTDRYLQLPEKQRDSQLVESIQALEDLTSRQGPEHRRTAEVVADLRFWSSIEASDADTEEERRRQILATDTYATAQYLSDIFTHTRRFLDYMVAKKMWRPKPR